MHYIRTQTRVKEYDTVEEKLSIALLSDSRMRISLSGERPAARPVSLWAAGELAP